MEVRQAAYEVGRTNPGFLILSPQRNTSTRHDGSRVPLGTHDNSKHRDKELACSLKHEVGLGFRRTSDLYRAERTNDPAKESLTNHRMPPSSTTIKIASGPIYAMCRLPMEDLTLRSQLAQAACSHVAKVTSTEVTRWPHPLMRYLQKWMHTYMNTPESKT